MWVKLAEANLRNSLQEELLKKDKELTDLKAESSNELTNKLSEKELEISELKSKVQNAETEKKLEVSEAIKKIEKEQGNFANDLKSKETEKQLRNLINFVQQRFRNHILKKTTTQNQEARVIIFTKKQTI